MAKSFKTAVREGNKFVDRDRSQVIFESKVTFKQRSRGSYDRKIFNLKETSLWEITKCIYRRGRDIVHPVSHLTKVHYSTSRTTVFTLISASDIKLEALFLLHIIQINDTYFKNELTLFTSNSFLLNVTNSKKEISF